MLPKRRVGATVAIGKTTAPQITNSEFFIACSKCKEKVELKPLALDVVRLKCKACGFEEEQKLSEVIDVC